MTDEQWEAWEEWLEHATTRRFLGALAQRANAMKANWMESIWQQDAPDPNGHGLPNLRERSKVYEELSKLDRETMTELTESD